MAQETYVTLVGRLTADPDLKNLDNGSTVCNFTVAANPRIYNSQSGGWEDGPASFHDCEIWNTRQSYPANHVAESLVKATPVVIYGRLQQIAFTTKEGENRRKWVVKVDEIGPSLRFRSVTLGATDGERRGQPNGQRPAQATQPPPQQQQDPWANTDPWAAPAGAEPPF